MRIGVYICQVGAALANEAALEAVAHYAANLPQVESVRLLGLMPSIAPDALATRLRRPSSMLS